MSEYSKKIHYITDSGKSGTCALYTSESDVPEPRWHFKDGDTDVYAKLVSINDGRATPVRIFQEYSYRTYAVGTCAYFLVTITQSDHQKIVVTWNGKEYTESFYVTDMSKPITAVTITADDEYAAGTLHIEGGAINETINNNITIYAEKASKITSIVVGAHRGSCWVATGNPFTAESDTSVYKVYAVPGGHRNKYPTIYYNNKYFFPGGGDSGRGYNGGSTWYIGVTPGKTYQLTSSNNNYHKGNTWYGFQVSGANGQTPDVELDD